jgi:hypothetical protein
MKKLVIITVLVVGLIGGLVGGTALAATRSLGSSVLMQAGGDAIVVTAANETTIAQPSYSGFVHVSLTVTVSYMQGSDPTGDYIGLVFVHADKNGAKRIDNDTIWFSTGPELVCGKATKTIEFDVAKAASEPCCWRLYAYNAAYDDLDFGYPWRVAYTYTMTYPSTQNTQ